MTDRRFRPALGTECLESRLLLDGSGFVGPMPPSYPQPPSPGSGSTNPAIIALSNQVQQIVMNGQVGPTFVNVPGMVMANFDDEVKRINDIRDKFNKGIDAIIAIDNNEVVQLTAVVGRIDEIAATLDATNPADQADLLNLVNIRANVVDDISTAQAHANTEVLFKIVVNKAIDSIIARIQGQIFEMSYGPQTEYFSDAYQAMG